jgi:hypothetical protein
LQIEMLNWPTPTTAEAGKISNQPNYGQKGLSNHPAIVGKPKRARAKKNDSTVGLHHQASRKEEMSRPVLNPDWVEMLMGFPPGWSRASAKSACDLWATPSSRKSRKRSGEQ